MPTVSTHAHNKIRQGVGFVHARSLRFRNLLSSTELTKDLTADQAAELASICQERRFRPGAFILREGDFDRFVYILVDGLARLLKKTSLGNEQIAMGELRPGDVLGELKIVDPQPSSASVSAVTQVTAAAIDLDTLAHSPALIATRATVLRNVGRILATRLRTRTNESADAIKRELEASRARAHAGRFLVLMFGMMATYEIIVSIAALLPERMQPPLSILSFVLAIWTVVPVALSLRRTPFPLASYGLTLERAGPIALQALIWTTPLLVIIFAAKLAMMKWVPSMETRPLFDPAPCLWGVPSISGSICLQ